MRKEGKCEAKVGVGIEAVWRALTKELWFVMPKIVPNLVTDAEILEGDGGFGTVYLFKFGPDLPNISYQKEKIVEFDESLHQIGLQVIEGGRLNLGFMLYRTTFQLTPMGNTETLVDFHVVYETEHEETQALEETMKSTVAFIKCLETFLKKQSS